MFHVVNKSMISDVGEGVRLIQNITQSNQSQKNHIYALHIYIYVCLGGTLKAFQAYYYPVR